MGRSKRAFRASVVTVLAAFAPVGGCADEGVSACPASEPAEGSACVGELTCGYNQCPWGGHATREYVCEEGKFDFGATSCNPPFLLDAGPDDAGDAAAAASKSEAGLVSCPTSEPVVGSACSGTLKCDYGAWSCFSPPRQYLCERGEIVRRQSFYCNPPLLRDGGPDASSDAGDADNGDAARWDADASDGATSDAAATDAGSCPAERPVNGAACAGELSCVYEVCVGGGGHPTFEARCQQGAFTILRTSCNPPPLDGSIPWDAAQADASSLMDGS